MSDASNRVNPLYTVKTLMNVSRIALKKAKTISYFILLNSLRIIIVLLFIRLYVIFVADTTTLSELEYKPRLIIAHQPETHDLALNT
jgi:hypothetical protein